MRAFLILAMVGWLVALGTGCEKECGNGRNDPGETCDYNTNYNGWCGNCRCYCERTCTWSVSSNCTVCGDGLCDPYEHVSSCPEDCADASVDAAPPDAGQDGGGLDSGAQDASVDASP